MDMHRIQLILSAFIVLLAGQPAAKSADGAPTASMPTAAEIHWWGMKKLSSETNAAHFMTIWNLPESGRLEQQTLDKLSQASWRLLHLNVDANAAALLRPLLEDAVEDESYFQIRRSNGLPGDVFFAIQLDDRRAALWQTNLAVVLQSLTGIRPVPASPGSFGWSLKKHHAPQVIELTRVRGWVVVVAADDVKGPVAELRARIQRGQPPFRTGSSHDWLEADLNPAQLLPILTTLNPQLSTLNHFHLSVTGDGTNVLTQGTADFSRPLALDLKPWNIPTNLIDGSSCSLTAIRGFAPWLASAGISTNLWLGPPPDQLCCWGQPGLNMLSYFAAPCPDASNAVDRLADYVLKNQNHWYDTNFLARFQKSTNYDGLEWRGLPYMTPFLRSITVRHQGFIFAGGFPNSTIYSITAQQLQNNLDPTNLVYFDSEITGFRVQHWTYMGQFARVVLGRPQLPSQCAGLLWLKSITPKLGRSVTQVTRVSPDQLAFTRQSSSGFTGVELNLLADWLESPSFPIGLHTTASDR
jgi:hypothetical protein